MKDLQQKLKEYVQNELFLRTEKDKWKFTAITENYFTLLYKFDDVYKMEIIIINGTDIALLNSFKKEFGYLEDEHLISIKTKTYFGEKLGYTQVEINHFNKKIIQFVAAYFKEKEVDGFVVSDDNENNHIGNFAIPLTYKNKNILERKIDALQQQLYLAAKCI